MTQWHRIDDPSNPPPKDGTQILTGKMVRGETRMLCVEVNEWNDPKKTGIGSLGWWKSTALTAPTHWMPLPAPPEGEHQ